jgi:hypothetical protein
MQKKRRETIADVEKKKQTSITAMPKSEKKTREKNLTNRSVTRLEKKSEAFNDRKGSPMHERIIKNGAVLNRKTSLNPQKGFINPFATHVIDARLSTSLEKKNNSERAKAISNMIQGNHSGGGKLTIVTSCNPHLTPTGKTETACSIIQSPKGSITSPWTIVVSSQKK